SRSTSPAHRYRRSIRAVGQGRHPRPHRHRSTQLGQSQALGGHMSTDAADVVSPPDVTASAPDTRGSSSPFARSVFVAGTVALSLVLPGPLAVHVTLPGAHT